MNEEYAAYLNSDAWRAKRLERLKISKFRCAACGASGVIQVHHLTYARIFNEPMADLLPLCDPHHDLAEQFVRAGKLPRSEDVLFLASETIRLLLLSEVRYSRPKDIDIRNALQEELISNHWFIEALRHGRKEFKKIIRSRLRKHPLRRRMLANCFAMYDHRKEQILAVL